MAAPLILNALNSGELSPALYGRTDLQKYHAGLALCRNFFIDTRGGIVNRSGTKYLGQCKDSDFANRLIPFTFSTLQSYALVFGNGTMRVIMDGGYVLEPTTTITGVTQANPGVVTDTAHGYSNTDLIFIDGIVGMTELNGKFFTVADRTANTYTLLDLFGNPVNTSAFTAYVSGGSAGRVFTLLTPYAGDDLALLKFTQSADTMTICHPDYVPAQLTRSQHWIWTLTPITFSPSVESPTTPTATPGTAGTTDYRYVITAISGASESRASASATASSAPLSTTPGAVVTVAWTGVPGAVQYYIYRTSEIIAGTPPAGSVYGFIGVTNGVSFIDNNIQPNFSISPPLANNPFLTQVVSNPVVVAGGAGYLTPYLVVNDATGVGARLTPTVVAGAITAVTIDNEGSNYTSPTVSIFDGGQGASGIVAGTGLFGSIADIDVITGGQDYNAPTVTVVSGGGSNAVLTANVTAGVITSVTINVPGQGYGVGDVLVFTDTGGTGASITLDVATTPNYPSCTCYFQQRQVYGATDQVPDQLTFSKSGDYLNMDYSSPSKDDDSIQITIASQQVNAIKAIIPFTSLIVFSSGSAWKVDSGQQGGALTPASISALPQAFSGSSDVPPITINYDLLYVQDKQSAVRDLSYNFYQNIYTGNDISVLANHLFFGHEITEWAWAQEPHKVVWCVRDDGILLSLTYLKEQEVYAWARHDTINGRVKSVCTIPEDEEDAVYLIVERLVQGQYLQYIERFESRLLGGDASLGIPGDLDKCFFVDCGLRYPLTFPDETIIPAALVGIPEIASVAIIDGGSGYVSPILTVNDETGTGAVLTATVASGVITAINVLSGGQNYTNPQVTIVGAGSGAILQPVVQSPVVMRASSSIFTSANIGDVFRGSNGMGVVTFQTGTAITVNVIRPLTSIWPMLSGEWSLTTPVSEVSGLEHLEGQTVAILADGNVQPQQEVIDGAVTLEQPATSIVVGLPITAQAQSLYLDTGQSPTMQTKRLNISFITARVLDSRGLKMGNTFDTLYEIKERNTQTMGQPIQLITTDERVAVDSKWETPKQFCIQQDQPLPAQVQCLIIDLAEGDTR